jgi:hypothetical protein
MLCSAPTPPQTLLSHFLDLSYPFQRCAGRFRARIAWNGDLGGGAISAISSGQWRHCASSLDKPSFKTPSSSVTQCFHERFPKAHPDFWVSSSGKTCPKFGCNSQTATAPTECCHSPCTKLGSDGPSSLLQLSCRPLTRSLPNLLNQPRLLNLESGIRLPLARSSNTQHQMRRQKMRIK